MNKTKTVKLGFAISAMLSIAIGALSINLPIRSTVAAGEAFSTVANKTGYVLEHIPVTDLTINGEGDENLHVNLYAPSGSLNFTSTTGVTFDGDSFGQNIQMSGTRSKLNAALATLRFYPTETGTVTIEARLGGGDGDVYNPDNGHVYQVVEAAESGITWAAAEAAAEGMTYGGVNGYLATITSQDEHDFVASRLDQDGWIGANELDSEGHWKWMTGPEAGTEFWDEADGGNPVGEGTFTNWAQYEPSGVESLDCVQIWFSGGQGGKWDDVPCTIQRQYYVVEFGSDEEHLPTVSATSFQITANAQPEAEIVSLSPADNATDVAVDSNLVITFNRNVTASEGVLHIYRSADDSEYVGIENYDDEYGTFSGYDSDTITIDPAMDLEPSTNYYVTFDDVFYFSDEGGMSDYAIADKTSWNFTTSDADGIAATVENNAPNDGDANNDGTLDSQQPHVVSFVNPVTDAYMSAVLSDTCAITEASSEAEMAKAKQDGEYNYFAGLLHFSANCSDGSTTVQLYYYDENDQDLVLRKYNPTTQAYTTISDATITRQEIGGQSVVRASYTIVDNGPLDLNPATGVIDDPVGLAVVGATDPTSTPTPTPGSSSSPASDSDLALPATGAQMAMMTTVGIVLLVLGGGLVYYNRRNKGRVVR